MRSILFAAIVSVSGILVGCHMYSAEGDPRRVLESDGAALAGDRQPVLVELFTSEGCSSCPPADRNLAFLEKQQPVTNAEAITLAFHVDYWDRLGWKDRFSSAQFSRRQETYAQAFKLNSNYTPQMIVDGRSEFVGSDSGRAAKEIASASLLQKATVEIGSGAGKFSVRITGLPEHSDATVYAALAENALSSRVERGENSGKTLEHVSVVRELKELGTLQGGLKSFDSALSFQPPADAKTQNLKVVVFVQENESRKVIGIGRSEF